MIREKDKAQRKSKFNSRKGWKISPERKKRRPIILGNHLHSQTPKASITYNNIPSN
jgi:hypothetical protein